MLLGIPPSAAAQLVLLAREHEGDAEAVERAIRSSLTRSIDAASTELSNTSLDEDDEDDEDDAGDGDAGAPA